jgi:O-acetyl-ADP-ribose deacetylase (regulator of RNase III)
MKYHLIHGDITTFKGDVIVNAANEMMLGGAGVDGAIHRAAGPKLRDACLQVWEDSKATPQWGGYDRDHGVRCPTGSVRPTPAFDLPCKWVFHTTGPIWPGTTRFQANVTSLAGNQMKVGATELTPEDQARKTLRECYKKALLMAAAMDLESIAYPAISTGVYGVPMATCAKVVSEWAYDYSRWPLSVYIYLFNDADMELWEMMAERFGVEVAT